MNIKLQYGDEIHRVKAQPRNFSELREAILKTFKLVLPPSYKIKYRDSDDELINIDHEEDFEMCFRFYVEENMKILKIIIKESHQQNQINEYRQDIDLSKISKVSHIDSTPLIMSEDLTNKIIPSKISQIINYSTEAVPPKTEKFDSAPLNESSSTFKKINNDDFPNHLPNEQMTTRRFISDNHNDLQVENKENMERSKSFPLSMDESQPVNMRLVQCYLCMKESKNDCKNCLGRGEFEAKDEDIELIKHVLEFKLKDYPRLKNFISMKGQDILSDTVTSQLSKSKMTMNSSTTVATPSSFQNTESSFKRAQLTTKATLMEEEFIEEIPFHHNILQKDIDKPESEVFRGLAKKTTFHPSTTKDLGSTSSILNNVTRGPIKNGYSSENLSKSMLLPSKPKVSNFSTKIKIDGNPESSPTGKDIGSCPKKGDHISWGAPEEASKPVRVFNSQSYSKTETLPKAKLVTDIKVVTSQVKRPFLITLEFRNTGGDQWPDNISLQCVTGIFEGFREDFDSLYKDESKKIRIPLIATKSGKQKSFWRLSYKKPGAKEGDSVTFFGPRVELEHNIDGNEEEIKKGDSHRSEDLSKKLKAIPNYKPDVEGYLGKFHEMFMNSESLDEFDFVDLYQKYMNSIKKLEQFKYI